MQISDIPAHLGITATSLADLMETSKQNLQQYISGARGKPSKFLTHLLDVANLQRVEIVFPDVFDHPAGENPEAPEYWLNIALEALREAEKRGMPMPDIAIEIARRGVAHINQNQYDDE